jgi:hypothetical protein
MKTAIAALLVCLFGSSTSSWAEKVAKPRSNATPLRIRRWMYTAVELRKEIDGHPTEWAEDILARRRRISSPNKALVRPEMHNVAETRRSRERLAPSNPTVPLLDR